MSISLAVLPLTRKLMFRLPSALNMVYNMMHIQLHRPFFRRRSADTTTNVSTEKCLAAAANIVRLVKLLKSSSPSGLRRAACGVQQ